MVMDRIALILTIIGGLNWGSVGIFRFDFVQALLGEGSELSRIVFVQDGLAAVWCVSLLIRSRNEIVE